MMKPILVIGSAQKNAYVGSVEDHAPCVAAAYGMGGGQIAMIVYVETDESIRSIPDTEQ